MKKKMYTAAPLPFVGQKRKFVKEYIKVVDGLPDDAVVVDLFGGSGLLAHIAKCSKPAATVVYNDFDNYRQRLAHIPQTNALLADLRNLAADTPRHKPITGAARTRIFNRLQEEEAKGGYMDFITLSSSLMFSMNYVPGIEEMKRETLYNNIRRSDYPLCPDYLDGLAITSCDYRELYERYKDVPGAVFIVDPPYLSTDVGTYKMHWRLPDYLDVLTVLRDNPFVYFTSGKSSIVELCEWLGLHKDVGNPFEGCRQIEIDNRINYNSVYKDIMLVKDSQLPQAA